MPERPYADEDSHRIRDFDKVLREVGSAYDRAFLHYQQAQILERRYEFGRAVTEYTRAAAVLEDSQQDADSQMLLEAASERATRIRQMQENIWGEEWIMPTFSNPDTSDFRFDPFHKDEASPSGSTDTTEPTDAQQFRAAEDQS